MGSGTVDEDKVIIFDTTLRDGEQSPGATLQLEEKVEIAHQLARLGVDIIEAGFPISSEGEFQAVRRIAEEVEGPVIAALSRVHIEDVDRAWEAIRVAPKHRIHVFGSSSDIHLKYQYNWSRQQLLDAAVQSVARAKSYCEDVEFSPMDCTRSDPEFVYELLSAVIEVGANTLNIPDTVGYASPEEMIGWFQGIKRRVKGIDKVVLSVHCHNDLGLATANTLTAVMNGCKQVEVTINGIGERAGNTSLEEVVMSLHTRHDYFKKRTNIDTTQIYTASRMVSNYTGMVVQPNKAVVGDNAFAHESGIHQDGVLKNRITYEIMDARSIGKPGSDLVLGKLSGRHGFSYRLGLLGYQLPHEEFGRAFKRFKDLADRKKVVTDRDLEAIVADEVRPRAEVWEIVRVQVSCGEPAVPTATVTLKGPDGREKTEVATGTGPVDATYKAIDRIVGISSTLVEYSVRSVTEGMDAEGEVTVRIAREGKVFLGRGSSTDIIVASARAYVSAVNRLVVELTAAGQLAGVAAQA